MKETRLPGYIYDELPPLNTKVQVLIDHKGTPTLLTLLCRWTEEGWVRACTGVLVDRPVSAWRYPDQGKTSSRMLQSIIKSRSND